MPAKVLSTQPAGSQDRFAEIGAIVHDCIDGQALARECNAIVMTALGRFERNQQKKVKTVALQCRNGIDKLLARLGGEEVVLLPAGRHKLMAMLNIAILCGAIDLERVQALTLKNIAADRERRVRLTAGPHALVLRTVSCEYSDEIYRTPWLEIRAAIDVVAAMSSGQPTFSHTPLIWHHGRSAHFDLAPKSFGNCRGNFLFVGVCSQLTAGAQAGFRHNGTWIDPQQVAVLEHYLRHGLAKFG